MTITSATPSEQQQPDSGQVAAGSRQRTLEPSLLSMIVAALVLLAAVGTVLWWASSVPVGRSVVVTIRNP